MSMTVNPAATFSPRENLFVKESINCGNAAFSVRAALGNSTDHLISKSVEEAGSQIDHYGLSRGVRSVCREEKTKISHQLRFFASSL
jgi:hypothetical protein